MERSVCSYPAWSQWLEQYPAKARRLERLGGFLHGPCFDDFPGTLAGNGMGSGAEMM